MANFTSIVDYLKSQNKPSDFNSRAVLAQQKGIQNYTGTAEQNINLLNQLQTQTPTQNVVLNPEQQAIMNNAYKVMGTTPPVSSATDLGGGKTPVITPPVTDTTNYGATIASTTPTAPTTGTTGTTGTTTEKTQAQKDLEAATAQSTSLMTRIKELMGLTEQKATTQAGLETTANIAGQQKDIQDLTNQLNAITAENTATPIRIQEEFAGRGATAGGVAPIEAGRQRELALRALTVSADLKAKQGNLTLAKQQITDSVNLQYAPLEAELKNKATQLDMLKQFVLTPAEQARKEELTAQVKKEDEALAVKKAAELEFNKNVVTAQSAGMKSEEANQARTFYNEGKVDEANQIVAGYTNRKDIQTTINNLIEKYPDAGITSSDTLATASAKAAGSPSFQNQKVIGTAETGYYALQNGKYTQVIPGTKQGGIVGETNDNVSAYADQYASTGKLPPATDLKNAGITASQVATAAKELPKSDGTLVDNNTGVKSGKVSEAVQNGYSIMYSVVQLSKQLKELDKERVGGIIAGTLGKVFGSDAQQRYIDLREQISDLLARARTGAAINATEEARYFDMLPSRFSEPLTLGTDSQVKIDNFIKNISSDLSNKLSTQGLSIYGFSKVGNYTVGDIIQNAQGQQGRVNPDGSVTIIK